MLRKARLRDKRGNACRQQNHDKPRAETQHQRSEGDHGDHILHDLKAVVDQLHRLVAALAPGILQPIVKIRVFEESHLQGQCLANDFGANAVGELKLNQLLNEPPRVIERGAEQK